MDSNCSSDETYKIVRQARQDKNLKDREDLLAQFLKMGDKLTDKHLHDVILNFIIAGRGMCSSYILCSCSKVI